MEMMMEKRHLSRSSTKRSSPPKTHHRHVSWWSPLHTGIIRELFVFGADHIKPQTLISIGIVEMCTVWHWVCWVGGGHPWHWQSTDYFFEFFWFYVSFWTVLFWSPPCFLSTFLFSAQFNQLGICSTRLSAARLIEVKIHLAGWAIQYSEKLFFGEYLSSSRSWLPSRMLVIKCVRGML